MNEYYLTFLPLRRYSMILINESELASSCLTSYLRILFSSPSFLFFDYLVFLINKKPSFSIPSPSPSSNNLHWCLHYCLDVPSYCLHGFISLQNTLFLFLQDHFIINKRIDKTRTIDVTTNSSNSGVIISYTSSSSLIACVCRIFKKNAQKCERWKQVK